jgi:hypothetical protein
MSDILTPVRSAGSPRSSTQIWFLRSKVAHIFDELAHCDMRRNEAANYIAKTYPELINIAGHTASNLRNAIEGWYKKLISSDQVDKIVHPNFGRAQAERRNIRALLQIEARKALALEELADVAFLSRELNRGD